MFYSSVTLRYAVCVIVLGLCGVLAGDEPRDKRVAKCGHCDVEDCRPVTDSCPETHRILDSCNCCNVCRSDQHPAKLLKIKRDVVCSKVKCPRGQMCVLNIQDLPVCRCPSKLSCPRKQRKFCGKNGVTYKSRCLLKVDECSSGKKIRIAHKGPCPGYEKIEAEERQAERQARRAERLARRAELWKIRQAKGKGRGKRRKAKFYRGRI
ncbi:agrin-like [Lineus longissimus]|uniref:agrin-like n=1 Tax=Lineus longissimus TaxID=88925 RepID=UPI002B4C3178